ncbi:MAG: alpha/beta fold hydrolase [Bryobacteraceae bacterium]
MIATNFWPVRLDERRFPVARRLYETEPGVRVLVEEQRPGTEPRGDIVMVHGLEGSSAARYMKSMARAALESGYAAHRLNLRSCGGTAEHCRTGYHSGLTSDLLCVLRRISAASGRAAYVAGFSLGGNVALKLAGELGEGAEGILGGVVAVSAPIDLAASVDAIERRRNWLYHSRFLRRLKSRASAIARKNPGLVPPETIARVSGIREFDDTITAPMFGFRGAAEYYATQSASCFLDAIRVPALLIHAKDDPVVPFEIFERLAGADHPFVRLLALEHGGHMGFIERNSRNFWTDDAVIEWIEGLRETAAHGVR